MPRTKDELKQIYLTAYKEILDKNYLLVFEAIDNIFQGDEINAKQKLSQLQEKTTKCMIPFNLSEEEQVIFKEEMQNWNADFLPLTLSILLERKDI